MAVDSEFLDKEYGEKIAQRQRDFGQAFTFFRKEFSKKHPDRTLVYSVEAPTELTYLYFHWSYTIVKPFVRHLSDRFKIASNTEFAIMYLRPLSIAEGSVFENLAVNASFAFYMALNIMLNFDEETDSASSYRSEILSFKGAIAPLEDGMEKIIENHRRYITTFDVKNDSPPIILNAFVWEMIDLFYKFQWQSLAV